jgi:phage-related protein
LACREAHLLASPIRIVRLPGYASSDIIARTPKPVIWLGSSLAIVRAFPDRARSMTGRQLRRVQEGHMPTDFKPMANVGPGVAELRVHMGGEYRVVFVAHFEEAVYVLHAFEKRTRKTSQIALDLARTRLRQLQRARERW